MLVPKPLKTSEMLLKTGLYISTHICVVGPLRVKLKLELETNLKKERKKISFSERTLYCLIVFDGKGISRGAKTGHFVPVHLD